MNERVRILYITNIPSPYRVLFFEMLGKKCDLTVVFEQEASADRDDSWSVNEFTCFKAIFCKGLKVSADHSVSLVPLKYLKRDTYDYIIITNNVSVCGLIEITQCKLLGVDYFIEGDGAFVPKEETTFKRLIKRYLIRGAKGYFSTCKNHDKYYIYYGAEESSIYRYTFSSVSKTKITDVICDVNEQIELKTKLGMNNTKSIIFVGSFIKRKGVDILLEIAKRLDNIDFYFAGGLEIPKELWTGDVPENVHLLGFILPEKLADYYKCVDLMVLPTREDIWGLVVNEALSCGCPVITTDRCNAGLELISEDINGFIVEDYGVESFIYYINKFFSLSETEKRQMREQAIQSVLDCTVERMVDAHIKFLKKLK